MCNVMASICITKCNAMVSSSKKAKEFVKDVTFFPDLQLKKWYN